MDPNRLRSTTRRWFLKDCSVGLGALALGQLLARDGLGQGTSAQTARLPHFTPKAKRVIYLHMAGSPSQLDLFDYKPKLEELDGQPIPASFIENERFAFIK